MIYPNGWCRVVTFAGQDGGLGFHCTACHLQFNHHAPKKIQHCGRVDEFKPGLFDKVPEIKLPYGGQRAGMLLV